MEKEEIKAIADLSMDKNFLIISDEIYEKIIYDGTVEMRGAGGAVGMKDAIVARGVRGFGRGFCGSEERGHEDIETGPPDPLATVAVGGFTPLSYPSSSLFPGPAKIGRASCRERV